jgi:hypothetical protein
MLLELIQNEIAQAIKRCSNCGKGLICDSTKLGTLDGKLYDDF